jgi:hypothetical protein
MATLKAIILGNLSAELSYEVDGDSILWGDGADDHVGIVKSSQCEKIRFTIELESLNADELDRLEQLAWEQHHRPG